jgi:hypothetical protein
LINNEFFDFVKRRTKSVKAGCAEHSMGIQAGFPQSYPQTSGRLKNSFSIIDLSVFLDVRTQNRPAWPGGAP